MVDLITLPTHQDFYHGVSYFMSAFCFGFLFHVLQFATDIARLQPNTQRHAMALAGTVVYRFPIPLDLLITKRMALSAWFLDAVSVEGESAQV